MHAQQATLDRAYLDPLVRELAADLTRPGIREFYLSGFQSLSQQPDKHVI